MTLLELLPGGPRRPDRPRSRSVGSNLEARRQTLTGLDQPSPQPVGRPAAARTATPNELAAEHLQALLTAWATARPSRTPGKGRGSALEWIEANLDRFEGYRGKWVVVEGEGIMASSVDYAEARQAAAVAGLARPLIFYVPAEEVEGFMGI